MDNRKALTQENVIALVNQYKERITPMFKDGVKVFLYGSYSKGYANPDSDIDVAVVVPRIEKSRFEVSSDLNYESWKVSSLIEPVLLVEGEASPLYRDVMRTGRIIR